jgi:hypothetical protein
MFFNVNRAVETYLARRSSAGSSISPCRIVRG